MVELSLKLVQDVGFLSGRSVKTRIFVSSWSPSVDSFWVVKIKKKKKKLLNINYSYHPVENKCD